MTTRSVPQSYYYSGQGRVIMGDRDPLTGRGFNFLEAGNIGSLSVDTATTKFTHKESMSGNRGIDISNFKEKVTTAKMQMESWSKENIAMGLYGVATNVTTLAVTGELHTYTTGFPIVPLRHPNVTAVVVTNVTQANAVVTASNYIVDPEFGTLRFVTTPTGLATGDTISVAYTSGVHWRVDAYSQPNVVEKFFRFEGLNTNDGSEVLVQIPRFAIDPIAALPLINDELGFFELVGNVLQDPFITSGSTYMTVDRIG